MAHNSYSCQATAEAPTRSTMDASVKVWRVSNGSIVFKLPTSYQIAWSVVISPDGQLLAAGLNGTVDI